ADRNRSHWSTSKTPSYTKSVSWHHHPIEHKGFSHAGNHFLPGKKRICELTQIIYGDVNKV
ncbi:hypothetical protein, partial [Escherichia coli]